MKEFYLLKMKKVIVLIFLVLLFISGCQGTNKTGLGSEPNGLDIKFLNLQPRDNLKEDESFNIGLELTNNAECDINNGEICVEDTLSGSWGGVEKRCASFNLNKVEVVNNRIRLDKIVIRDFRDFVYSNLERDLYTNIIAKAVYNCNVVLGPQLCVKSQIEDESEDCKAEETIGGNTLGFRVAPVSIYQIDKSLVPEYDGVRLNVALHLKKMSEGNLVDEEGSMSLKINVEYQGYGELICDEVEEGVYYWKDDDTEKIINCNRLLENIDYVENPLRIELDYNYEATKSKYVQIINKD